MTTHFDLETQSLTAIQTDLGNWQTVPEIAKAYPQFNHSQLKTLFWKREERAGLAQCCRMVGKKLYVNVPLFGLWLAGQLPGQ